MCKSDVSIIYTNGILKVIDPYSPSIALEESGHMLHVHKLWIHYFIRYTVSQPKAPMARQERRRYHQENECVESLPPSSAQAKKKEKHRPTSPQNLTTPHPPHFLNFTSSSSSFSVTHTKQVEHVSVKCGESGTASRGRAMRMIRSPGGISWLAKRPVPLPGTGRAWVWLTSGRDGGGGIWVE